ncbi:MAG: endonuclease/exonuclease/phosphatase family protein [Desulfobacteraceae bacterium]|jgi:endonuclease/exonuclease/phosphatase family metal-dependent hydrolase|nr:endonuclease/exonuclease/phosphatase family protein [Desulfobacteraceae bacterium]
MAFRLATYNIHRCIGADGVKNPQRIADVLRAMNADLVALQEVAYDPETPGDILRFLSRAAGAQAIAGPTLQEGKGRYGNVVLTRLTPREVKRIDISFRGREPRGAIQLGMATASSTVSVLATHLGLSVRERRRQITRIAQILGETNADVVILMGDFNEWFPWSPSLHRLKGFFAPGVAPATFPGRRPFFALDRIWVRPQRRLSRLHAFKTPLSRMASDHLPLVADIDL